MSNQIILRDYQQHTVQSVIEYFSTNKDVNKNPLAVLPTGAGKSIIAAEICRFFMQYDDMKVMLLTHSSELVKQNAQKINLLRNNFSLGVYASKLGKKDRMQRVICGTVQSVYKALAKNPYAFGSRRLLIIDEAHLLSDKDSSMYQQAIKALRIADPKMRVFGMSATPYRLDCGLLTEQDNAIFTDICIDVNEQIPEFIKRGYLAPLVTLPSPIEFDFSKAKITAGDYNKAAAERILDDDDRLNQACDLMVANGKDRKAWIVFASGVSISNKIVDMLNQRGIKTAAVNSKQSKAENDKAISDYKAGALQCLVSANQLTTGFDVPKIDFIGMLRPTISPSLHVQMLGRGMRVAEGKVDCLVLDFVRNFSRLGPVNNVKIPEKKQPRVTKRKEPLEGVSGELKECPYCHDEMPKYAKECPHCGGLVLGLEDIDLHDLSSGVAIDYSSDFKLDKVDTKLSTVLNMVASPHKAVSGKDCIKVSFSYRKYNQNRVLRADTYLNFDYEGVPARLACKMWENLKGAWPPPKSTMEAINRLGELKQPKAIEVIKRNASQKFDKIKRIEF